jgi:pilus assembly protein CpaE
MTTDPVLRDNVAVAAVAAGLLIEFVLEIPFSKTTDALLRRVRQADPHVILIDFDQEPELGLKLAQNLAEAEPRLRFIAFGPPPSPDFLLAAMRVGLIEYLPQPVESTAIQAALERVSQKLGGASAAKPRQPGRIYTFFGAKGGCGVTTAATNFAILTQRFTNKRTLLLDLDPHLGEAALLLGIQPRFSFIDVIQNFHRLDADLLESYVERHESGVELLSAPFNPERDMQVTGEQVRRVLQFLREHYDHIVVDAPSFSPIALAAFENTSQLFLLTTVDLPSLRNVQRFVPVLRQRLQAHNEQLRLVINRHSSNDPVSVRDLEDAVGLKVFWRLPNDYQPVFHAFNSGKPVALNSGSRYTRDLQALAEQVLTAPVEAAAPNGRPARTSLITRLTSIVRGKELPVSDATD